MEEKYTGRGKAGGAELSEEEEGEEEEEEESEVHVSGVETVRVEKDTVDHKLNISLASCFCSACRTRDYDKCFVRAEHPALVSAFTSAVVEEVVIMDTGVDPSRVDPSVGGRREKVREIEFAKRSSFCLMERVPGTQLGDSFCDST